MSSKIQLTLLQKEAKIQSNEHRQHGFHPLANFRKNLFEENRENINRLLKKLELSKEEADDEGSRVTIGYCCPSGFQCNPYAVIQPKGYCERLRGGGFTGCGEGSGSGSGLSTGSGDGSTGNDRGYSTSGTYGHGHTAEDSRGFSKVGARRHSFEEGSSNNALGLRNKSANSGGFKIGGENGPTSSRISEASCQQEPASSFARSYFGMDEDSANSTINDFHKKYDSDFSVYEEVAKDIFNRGSQFDCDDSGKGNSFGGRGDDHYSQRDGGFGGRGDGDMCVRDDGGFAVRGHSGLRIREHGAFGGKCDGSFENRDNGTFGEGGDNGLYIRDECGFSGRGDGGFRNRDSSSFCPRGNSVYEGRHNGVIHSSGDEAVLSRKDDRSSGSKCGHEDRESNRDFNTEHSFTSNDRYNQYSQKNRSKSSGYSG